MFATKELHFSRPTKWDDPYEARLSDKSFNSVYAQCWCRRGVSDAMWRIYSPDNLGVRIKTTKEELRTQLMNSPSKVDGCKTRVSLVKYMRQSELNIELENIAKQLHNNHSPSKALSSLFLKRNAFNHEAEVRAVFYSPNSANTNDFIRINVNPHKLIKSVLFDPRLPRELVSVYKYHIKEKLKYHGSVNQSQLYKQVKPIPVGGDEG